MGYDWDWTFLWPYRQALVQGIGVTLLISVLASGIGTAAGFLVGLSYRVTPLSGLCLLLNDVVRAIPLLVLLFFFYFAPLPQLVGLAPLSPFVATVVAMSVSQLAFTADLVYHAFGRVNPRALESARAVGLRERTVWRTVVLPDISKQILPAMIAFWIGIVKLSSLASVIGCHDLVYVASVAGAQRFRSLEVWTLAMIVYVALVLPLTLCARRIESLPWISRR